ncbi:hypothetical protein CSB09_01615 [Candidatus Gracilibacteria bacterium]|nr:MAG: hypothetical protein CSB09_01615 [Candidatus Gracilibacteria bacterium]
MSSPLLHSQALTITENMTLLDTGEFETAHITIDPNISLRYIYLGNNLPNRKRTLSVHSGAKLTGSAIIFGKKSGLQIESEILGDNAYSQLNLLGIATEKSDLSITGNAKVEKPYRNTKTRVDQKNILIGHSAKVQGIPRLEIATDDIEGGHSCRVYRLGGDVIFYLTSRGLSHEHAEQILLNSEIRSHLNGLDKEEQKLYCQKVHQALLEKT